MKFLPGMMLVLTLGLLAGCDNKAGTSTTATNVVAREDARASAAQLPDWSGIWSLTEETRDTRVAGMKNLRELLTPEYAAMLPSGPPRTDAGADAGGMSAAPSSQPKPQTGWRNNLTQCIPPGFPGTLTHPYAHEYLFTPGRVTMVIEDGEVRRIYTDGRGHPPIDELDDSLVGHSIGHWEGDTLVVDTVGIRPEAELSLGGLHVTRNTQVIERIRRKDANLLQIDTVITDPKIFKRPYSYTLMFERVAGELMENNCGLDQRDNDQAIDLTPPPAE